jgi:hypothetical protein
MKLISLCLVLLSACAAKAVRPVLTSPEQKIWLVKGVDEVYRCADKGAADQPPQPVCVPARMGQ